MTHGAHTYGVLAHGVDDDELEAPAAPTLADILENKAIVAVVTTTLEKLDGSGSKTFWWSNRAFTTDLSDTPENAAFDPCLVGLADSARPDFSPLGTADNSTSGTLKINDPAGARARELEEYDFNQKIVEIWIGRSAGKRWASRSDDPLRWFKRIGRFALGDMSEDGGTTSLSYRDFSYLLDETLIQDTRFAGTGTYEGAGSMLDEPKPLPGGTVYFVELRLVDKDYLIYQLVDGDLPFFNSVFVFDNAVLLTNDNVDTTNLYGASIAAGHFKTDSSRGLLRLGGTPVGRVCGVFQGVYRSRQASWEGAPSVKLTHPDVLHKLISRRLADMDGFLLNDASFAALADSLAATSPSFPGVHFDAVCAFITEDGQSLKSAANILMPGCASSWWMNSDGEMEVGRLTVPTAAEVELDIDETDILDIRRVELPATLWPPPYAIELLYSKVQSFPQTGSIAAGASADLKLLLQKPYKTLKKTDNDIRTRFKNAKIWKQFDTASADNYFALEKQGIEMLALHGGTAADGTIFRRQMFRIVLGRKGFLVGPYTKVRITHRKIGDAPKLFVASPAERRTVGNDPMQVDLLCWGGFPDS